MLAYTLSLSLSLYCIEEKGGSDLQFFTLFFLMVGSSAFEESQENLTTKIMVQHGIVLVRLKSLVQPKS